MKLGFISGMAVSIALSSQAFAFTTFNAPHAPITFKSSSGHSAGGIYANAGATPNARAQKFINDLPFTDIHHLVQVDFWSNWPHATYISLRMSAYGHDHTFFKVDGSFPGLYLYLADVSDFGNKISQLALADGCESNQAGRGIWHNRHYPTQADGGIIYYYAQHAETICPN